MRSDCRTRVVWAAFRERNFEVGEPFLRARSVPSKYYFFRTYASARRIFLIKSHISSLFLHLIPLVPPSYATYLPPISIGTSSEPHWNLIGISPNDERIIKQLPTIFKQLSFYNSSTTLDGIPSRVSRLSNTLDLLSSISQGTSMSIIQRGPRKRSWRYGVLLNCSLPRERPLN